MRKLFVIENVEPAGIGESRKMVVDHDRDTFLQTMGMVALEPLTCFRLVSKGRHIPFHAGYIRLEGDTDEVQRRYRWEIHDFGGSIFCKGRMGIQYYKFKDDDEFYELLLLAAEALFVYGYSYSATSRGQQVDEVKCGKFKFVRSDFPNIDS